MNRLLLPLVFVSLTGCGHKNVGTGRNSPAPAYAPPATTSNDAAIEDQQAAAPDAEGDVVDRAASETASETPPYNAKDNAPPPDKELRGDDPQASDTAATAAEASAPDSDANRTAAAEEPAADLADDITPETSSNQPKGSGAKLFRGLANSVSRAVMKTFADPAAALATPPEDDPFPNGEPADADPDVNR